MVPITPMARRSSLIISTLAKAGVSKLDHANREMDDAMSEAVVKTTHLQGDLVRAIMD